MDGLQWKTLIKMDDLGGKTPLFLERPICRKKTVEVRVLTLKDFFGRMAVDNIPTVVEGFSQQILPNIHQKKTGASEDGHINLMKSSEVIFFSKLESVFWRIINDGPFNSVEQNC